jgi:hypothetical protein
MKRLACALMIVGLSGCALSYPGRIVTIDTEDSLNQLSADSAPQQAVVNGWTTRDYLKLIAEQNTEHSMIGYVTVSTLLILIVVVLRQNRRLRAEPVSPEADQPPLPASDAQR